MDLHLSEATHSGTAGLRHGHARAEPSLTAQPTVQADGGPPVPLVSALTSHSDHRQAAPRLAAPGLVLVAAFAIFAGYHWLHLFPNGSTRPTALLFALFAAPATFVLTRHVDAPQVPGARIVARVCAVIGLVLGFVEAVDHNSPSCWLLGVTSLVLAMALVCLAFASEHHRPPPAPRH